MVFGRKAKLALGFLAGLIAAACLRKMKRPAGEDLQRMEFGTSTQRMGVRFTERIRDVFRFRWLTRRGVR